MLAPWKKSYDRPRQHIKKQKHYFADKGPSSQSYIVSSSHVWMWELDHEESWVLKNSCFWTVVLEKTLESALYCKKITPLHPNGNQSSIFVGRTWWSWCSNTLATWCAELTHWKRPLCQERLKMRGEGDDRGWDGRWLHGITDSMDMSFSRLWELSDWQGSLACCIPWIADSDSMERRNWTDRYV